MALKKTSAKSAFIAPTPKRKHFTYTCKLYKARKYTKNLGVTGKVTLKHERPYRLSNEEEELGKKTCIVADNKSHLFLNGDLVDTGGAWSNFFKSNPQISMRINTDQTE